MTTTMGRGVGGSDEEMTIMTIYDNDNNDDDDNDDDDDCDG